MTAKEKAIHYCIGLLEGLAVGELKDNAKTIELGVKGIRELEEHCNAIEEDKTSIQWSGVDSAMIDETLFFIREYQQSNRCKDENGMQNSVTCENWLKALKDRLGKKLKED